MITVLMQEQQQVVKDPGGKTLLIDILECVRREAGSATKEIVLFASSTGYLLWRLMSDQWLQTAEMNHVLSNNILSRNACYET